ncbi:hypothetical protein Mro03_75640 [Microbispora rosea subsp. rosea]|nr:hypothetical protein Mro03_75640 [Microbispora rosea subsp. rosea]
MVPARVRLAGSFSGGNRGEEGVGEHDLVSSGSARRCGRRSVIARPSASLHQPTRKIAVYGWSIGCPVWNAPPMPVTSFPQSRIVVAAGFSCGEIAAMIGLSRLEADRGQ